LSKAALVKELNRRGIPVPEGAKVADLEHRLEHWLSRNGWLVRLAKPASRAPQNPVTLIETKDTIWMPDSRMARMIVETKLVFVLGRCAEPPNDASILDVPRDFNQRWPEDKVGEEE